MCFLKNLKSVLFFEEIKEWQTVFFQSWLDRILRFLGTSGTFVFQFWSESEQKYTRRHTHIYVFIYVYINLRQTRDSKKSGCFLTWGRVWILSLLLEVDDTNSFMFVAANPQGLYWPFIPIACCTDPLCQIPEASSAWHGFLRSSTLWLLPDRKAFHIAGPVLQSPESHKWDPFSPAPSQCALGWALVEMAWPHRPHGHPQLPAPSLGAGVQCQALAYPYGRVKAKWVLFCSLPNCSLNLCAYLAL